MAGRPALRGMVADLVTLARAADLDIEFPDMDEHGLALAFLCYWFRGGCPDGESPSIQGLARRLGVSRALLYEWISRDLERKQTFSLARKDSAHVLAEDGLAIVDAAAGTMYSSAAQSRANYRKWLASVLDRATYGQQPAQVNVPISVAALHLHAHQARKTLPARPVALPKVRGDEVVIHTPQVEADQEVSDSNVV